MINGPYYLKNCWVAKKVYEKQKEKPKKMLNFIFYDVLVCEICSQIWFMNFGIVLRFGL